MSAYKRPEESRKRDTKLMRTLASVEKEREELRLRSLKEYRKQKELYRRAEGLKRRTDQLKWEKKLQCDREKELHRRENESKQREKLLKQKEKEALTASQKTARSSGAETRTRPREAEAPLGVG